MFLWPIFDGFMTHWWFSTWGAQPRHPTDGSPPLTHQPIDRLYTVPLITALPMQWLPRTSLWHHPNGSCLRLMCNPATCHDTSCIGNAEMQNISFRHDSKIIWIWPTCPFHTNLKCCPSPWKYVEYQWFHVVCNYSLIAFWERRFS